MHEEEVPHILTSQSGFIRTITLNRPQARNAYSVEMIDQLILNSGTTITMSSKTSGP